MKRGVGGAVVLLAVLAGCSSSAGYNLMDGSPRPADGCAMLTSGQVEDIVGTSGPFTGAHHDPAADGSPVWGCTWGTRESDADLRELPAGGYRNAISTRPDEISTPVPGVGDHAVQVTLRDGGNPYLYFTAGGRYYHVSVSVSRYADRDDPAKDATAERELAKVVAARPS